MKVPLLDLKAEYESITPEIDAALLSACEKSQFILGPAVASFEERFAEYCGVAACACVNSGTSALHLALLALGIGPGDEVICPSWTFVATAEAILYTGATPVLVDCDERTYNVSPGAVREAVTPRTKAIMPVHIYGRPAAMDEIAEIAGGGRGIAVVEDAAQAHGARYRGAGAGAIGAAGCFSFYPSKNLGAYGEGGAVVSNDEALIARIKRLRAHGETSRYIHGELGFNMRMEGIQGAVLCVKLDRLDEWNARRREIADKYRAALSGTPLILPAADDPGTEQVYHVYAVRAENRDRGAKSRGGNTRGANTRDALRAYLDEKGVGAAIHYLLPVHKQPMWIAAFGDKLHLPVSETLADEILSLPMHPFLTDDQIGYVAGCVREFYGVAGA